VWMQIEQEETSGADRIKKYGGRVAPCMCVYSSYSSVINKPRQIDLSRCIRHGGSCVVLCTAENFGIGKWQVESGYFGSLSPAASTTALSSSSVHYLLIPIIILSQEAR
jgi:hypothetical protein